MRFFSASCIHVQYRELVAVAMSTWSLSALVARRATTEVG